MTIALLYIVTMTEIDTWVCFGVLRMWVVSGTNGRERRREEGGGGGKATPAEAGDTYKH